MRSKGLVLLVMSVVLTGGSVSAQVQGESVGRLAVEGGRSDIFRLPPAAQQGTPSETLEEPGLLRTGRRPESHPFWNKSNVALFAGLAGARVLDYASTRNFRSRGLNEGLLTNAIVDNKPLFTGIEAAGVAASIGVSYWLHRRGHHKLEAWFSIAHITAGSLGAARNYGMKSPTLNRPGP